jgi:MFS family permease
LTAHWAFLFWLTPHLRAHPDLQDLTAAQKSQALSQVVSVVVFASITGNFLASALASWLGYRRAIAILCVGYFLSLLATFGTPHSYVGLQIGCMSAGLCQGIFALCTMYLPPLFPTLLRTTGAGFCYNIGRIAAGLGTVFFGLFASVGDYGLALVYASFLFLPAAAIAWFMPDARDGEATGEPVE